MLRNIQPFDQIRSDYNVTLVTAFFKLGKFSKDSPENVLTPAMYTKWIAVFSRITNPMVAYFDDDKTFDYFRNLRNENIGLMRRTMVVKVNRSDLWAFSLLSNISQIFSDPNYPKFLPNTVVPEYSCAMHAKYELVLKTVALNPFSTNYFAWIDIGLFRDIGHDVKMFHIDLPPKFNVSRVAYNQVYPRRISALPKDIYLSNSVWVCGCFFIGHKTVMKKWTQHYIEYTIQSLKGKVMNTDQQVVYAMVNDKYYHLDVNMQLFGPEEQWGQGKWNPWFHLGYLCIDFDEKTP